MLLPDQTYAKIGDLVVGDFDAFGCDWALRNIDGWGTSGVALSSTQKSRANGTTLGVAYAQGRSVAINGGVYAPSAEALTDALDRLHDAASLDGVDFHVIEASIDRWVPVKRSGDVIESKTTSTSAEWSVQFAAEDWRKFGADMTSTTSLPSTSGGLVIPTTIPTVMAETTVTGQVSLFNPGNETGPVWLRIDGPVSGPVVTHVSSGLSLVFSSSLTLSAGEWLDVDMEAQTVLANGQASRAGWVVQRGWSGFTPGENTWAFTAASYSASAQLTVTARPAWK